MPQPKKTKRDYESPRIREWGTVRELTAAVGGDAMEGSTGGGIPG